MNRVTVINIAGRALYLENEGAEAIDRWISAARATLEGDPDRDELLTDFEQAIADRCAAQAAGPTDVVATSDVEEVLSALGPVEPAVTPDAEAAAAGAAAETPLHERRLYRLTSEGEGAIAGVCAGVAAYINVDVTVVRVVTVIAALLSVGAVVLVYAAMALIVPAASTPDERLAVRGYGESAKDVMSRARANAVPALASVGAVLRVSIRALASLVYWALVLAIWVVIVAWLIAVVALFIDSEQLSTAFDSDTSTWIVALWVSAVVWFAAGLLIAIAAGARWLAVPSRPSNPETPGQGSLAPAAITVWFVFMTMAAVGAVTIPVAASDQVRDILDGEGRIEIFDEIWCLSFDHGSKRVEDTSGCDYIFSEDGLDEQPSPTPSRTPTPTATQAPAATAEPAVAEQLLARPQTGPTPLPA